MIKNKLALLAIIAASVLISAGARADRIEVQIGDQPFYTHGQRYHNGNYDMIWVPGHMSRFGHHWVHGQYVRANMHRHDLYRGHEERGEYNNIDHREYDRR